MSQRPRQWPVSGMTAPFPTKVRPMLAMPVKDAFDDKDWAFEVKWDGMRCVLLRNKKEGMLELRARSGANITHRYPEIAEIADSVIRCRESAVLDGELVVLGSDGLPDFQKHQGRMNVKSPKDIERLSRAFPATYFPFDILYLDGRNVQSLSFVDRRRILGEILANESNAIRISDYVEENGRTLFEKARKSGLEGIMAKNKASRYLQGTRSDQWLKIKGTWTQDCVVIGYTSGEGSREGLFDSLILAAYHDGRLRFIGHSGSGFKSAELKGLYSELKSLKIGRCPIDSVPYVNRVPTWVKPELVIEVKFSGWTRDRIMRAPIYLTIRDDKSPEECVIEEPKDVETAVSSAEGEYSSPAFTNLDKVFWPATVTHGKRTKGDLIEYYSKISDYILPHLRDRPLSLKRYPDGIGGQSFFQKNWSAATPDFVETIQVFSESRNATIRYIICNNKETLLWLANLGCIELHPWYSRVHDYRECMAEATGEKLRANPPLDEDLCGLGTPDFIVFDLDPYIYSGRENEEEEPQYNVKGFKAAVEIAFDLKDLMHDLRISSFVKTSGKTGLHIFVPVSPDYSYDQTRSFAEITGKILARRRPEMISMDWNVSKRRRKVFFDYKQNVRGKTLASILSVRPTEFATVSMPLDWKALENALPTDFTIGNVPDMLKRSGCAWQNVLNEKQDIAKLLEKVSSL